GRDTRLLGRRGFRLEPESGFAAQAAAGTTIYLATKYGYPLSTTHVVSGAVLGAGATKRLSAVRWGIAGNIVTAWLLTLPAAAAIGALTYAITRVFGTGVAGPVVVATVALLLVAYGFVRRIQQGAPVPAG